MQLTIAGERALHNLPAAPPSGRETATPAEAFTTGLFIAHRILAIRAEQISARDNA